MKATEFRKLIREEVRKVLKENVIADLEVSPKVLKIADKDPETNWENIQNKYKTKLIKKINSEESDFPLEVHEIIGTPYIVVDEMGFGVIFKKSDMPKVVAAIKDGSYFEMED
jgi:hypothetical protein